MVCLVVVWNRMPLNFILAVQGDICAIINSTCCSYVDQSGRIKKDLAEIWEQIQILHKAAFRNNTLNFDYIYIR